jgi:tetratricopeptide (TPR) repeat protein
VDPDPRAYFYRATALYHKDQYDNAIATARQGLDIFDGSRSDEAKYHFVIGESYVALNNIEAAKEEFRLAAYGDYAPRAEHYLETL